MVTRRSLFRSLSLVSLLMIAACAGARPTPGPGGEDLRGGGSPSEMERCHAAVTGRCAEAILALGGLTPGGHVGEAVIESVVIDRDLILVSFAAPPGNNLRVIVARSNPSPGAPPPLAATGDFSLFTLSGAPGAPTASWQIEVVHALAASMSRAPARAPAWLAPLRGPGKDGPSARA